MARTARQIERGRDFGLFDLPAGQELFLYLRVEDFDKAWDQLENDPVNQRWQEFMRPLFDTVEGKDSTERFAMMKEVFHLP
jgi:L-rhamnose mutarotase